MNEACDSLLVELFDLTVLKAAYYYYYYYCYCERLGSIKAFHSLHSEESLCRILHRRSRHAIKDPLYCNCVLFFLRIFLCTLYLYVITFVTKFMQPCLNVMVYFLIVYYSRMPIRYSGAVLQCTISASIQ